MNDQELFDYSDDHLHYEVSMLYDTADRLMHDPTLDSDPLVLNALIESFATHGRALATFLYPDPNAERDTDVKSDHYARNVPEWATARGTLPAELADVIKRTAKEIAHLTIGRHPAGSPRKL